MIEIESCCPFCGEVTIIKMPEGQSIEQWKASSDDFTRETLISCICFKCQSRIFHKPLPGDISWGKILTECVVCGCSIYETDVEKSCNCPQCYQPYSGDEN